MGRRPTCYAAGWPVAHRNGDFEDLSFRRTAKRGIHVRELPPTMNKLSQSHDQPASGSILQSGFASPGKHNGLMHEFSGAGRLRANCTGKFGDLRKALLVVLYDVFAFHCLVGFVFARVRKKVLAPI